MRSRRNILTQLQRLKPEQKLLLAGSLTTILGCFLPWYGISSRVVSEWWSGFGNIGSVAGYFISFFAITIIALTLLPLWDVKMKFPWSNEKISLAFASQILLLSLVFIVVYAQYAIYDSPNSSTRFGLYVTLVASILTFLGALANVKSAERTYLGFNQQELARVPRQHKGLEERGQELPPNEEPIRDEKIEREILVSREGEEFLTQENEPRYEKPSQYQKPQSFNF